MNTMFYTDMSYIQTSTYGSVSTRVSPQPRINLSPFTKDFRGEEHYNESIDQFFYPVFCRGKQTNN